MPTPATAVDVRLWRLLLAVVVICALYFLRQIILPVAVAGLITFVLSPIVSKLEKRLWRSAAVILTVFLAFTIFGVFAWLSTTQILSLARQLPAYKANLVAKVQALNTTGQGPFANVSKMLQEIQQETDASAQTETPSATRPMPVEVIEHPKHSSGRLLASAETLLAPIESFGMVLILAIFMLFKRDDLRDRIIGLIGRGHIGETTGFMRDAAKRVNRFLFMNLLTNAAFGIPVGIGLYFIGVPGAALWGALAMILRFVPYVGILIAMAFPITLSLAVFDNWVGPLQTMGLFLILELTVATIAEPLLYGASTGVSAFALIVAALFWTWLWGPIGLILSTPLTVCLLVMGTKIPQLSFLSTVLSEESALAPHEKFYHRLLAEDRNALNEIVESEKRGQPLENVYSGTVLPSLALVEGDFQRRTLDPVQHDAVIASIREVVDQQEVSISKAEISKSRETTEKVPAVSLKILGIPAESSADEVSTAMLTQAARTHGFDAETVSSKLSVNEVRSLVSTEKPDWIWICAVNPTGLSRCRHLCTEIRRQEPDVRISVGIWHPQEHLRNAMSGLQSAGAETVLTLFGEALIRLESVRDSYGDSFTAAPIPDNEADRLAALVELGLLGQGRDELFDRTTSELTKIFDVPIALVSLIDSGWQHFASQCGLGDPLAEEGRTTRDVSVCGHVVAANRPFIVEDLARDRRFAGNPLLRENKLRFYAGVPLRASNGLAVGSLCILDHRPRTVSEREVRLMQMIGENLMLEIEARAAKATTPEPV